MYLVTSGDGLAKRPQDAVVEARRAGRMTRPLAVPLPLGQTRAAFRPETLDPATRTVELVWTTGARVRRTGWDGPWLEELSLDPEAVDLRRLNAGANLLAGHNAFGLDGIIGVVESAWLEGKPGHGAEGRARVRLSSEEVDAPVVRKIHDGLIRHVSVGYITHKLEEVERGSAREQEPPVYRATRWEPVELTLCAVPADAGARIRSEDDGATYPCLVTRRTHMDDPTAAVIERPGKAKRGAKARALEERPPGQVPGQGEEVPPAVPEPEPEPDEGEEEPRDTTERAIAVERKRVQDIRTAVRHGGLPDDFADRFIEDGTAAADVPRAVLAERARTQPRVSRTVLTPGGDGIERLRASIQNALHHRIDPTQPLSAEGVRWQGHSVIELARTLLTAQGIRAHSMGRLELAAVALKLATPTYLREGPHGFLSTSEFPTLLANIGQSMLRAGYTVAERTFPPWTRQGTLPDFRISNRYALGVGPRLLKVPEHAEYTRGSMAATAQPIQLETWGRILAFTRQAMVNDDVGLFQRIPQMFGNSAAQVESDAVYGILTGNPPLSDGQPLFSAAHGNLMPAGVINLANVSAARQAMMNQKAPDGQFLSIIPRYLIVGPQQEMYAAQFLVPVTIVGQQTDITPRTFQNLELIVEPRITDVSWYLAASPAQVDTIEYAYLEGGPQGGPLLETREGWDIDGQEYKARMDFGAAPIDWRGLVKNPGALPTP